MSQRNRAEGWKHAKLSGHENEALVEAITENDDSLKTRILICGKKPNAKIKSIDFGGLKETDVDCVLGGKTKSKSDMHVYLEDGSSINISIKKSAGGQVFLIGVDRFVEGFEKQFNQTIPDNVKRAISLYWGTADDTRDVANTYGDKNKAYEIRKHRLTKETLEKYDPALSKALLDWFNENMAEIFDFCFTTGLASNKSDWANVIWYRNELAENDMDDLYYIEDIKKKLTKTAEYGNKTGGSTIQLPFGFVQWHSPRKVIPGCMQFHHNYQKIKDLMEK
ncbi:MAG: hypothetical protein J5911_01265 [Clostridia bacterium]|nr:hypothetical protein [Clostridia bacterium]